MEAVLTCDHQIETDIIDYGDDGDGYQADAVIYCTLCDHIFKPGELDYDD